MTDSISPIIHPMSLGELLDRAIRLYRQNFLKFIGIFAIPYIPLALIQTAIQVFTTTSTFRTSVNGNPSDIFSSPGWITASAGTFLVVFVQFIFVQGVATAALTRAVANNYTGKPVGILDSYRTLSTSWLKLILALILVFILVIILSIWTIIPCVGWFSGPGILFFIGLVVNPLIPPVISLENGDVFHSIRRAWDLARSRFWWLVGCALVLAVFGWLLVSGPVLLMNWLMTYALSSLTTSVEIQLAITTIIQTLITMLMSLLYVPLKLTIMTVVYFDLRTRSEGLDIALQLSTSQATENNVVSLPEITTKTSAPLITGIDIGRFALLSFAGIALYGLLIGAIFVLFGLLGLASSGF
ncbi:MAG: hypothetical protein U0Z26_11215 [Anaerolineales bacterium]